MARRKIPQTEAWNLLHKNRRLEEQIARQKKDWRSEWPTGVILGRVKPGETAIAIVETARRLQHAVVVVVQGEDIVFFGCEL